MIRFAPGLALLVLGSAEARAQDAFEIQVYEYATVPKAKWNLETHVNHSLRGITVGEGTVAPSQGQTHLTFELTRGITEYIELAGYLAFARRPGKGPEFAAWRIRPRVRFPEHWHLPVLLSLSAEVAFPRSVFEAEDITLEIRPIIEKSFGRLAIDLNPTLGRSLKGPGTSQGWEFEPGGRLAVTVQKRVDLSVEYYGALGPIKDFLPGAEQVHQFFTGGDIQLGDSMVLNLGLGLGTTHAGDRTVLKARLGWLF